MKACLGAVVGDLHKIQECQMKSGEKITKIKSQLTLLQHEGVKSFNRVLKQVNPGAARAEVSNNELVEGSIASKSSVNHQRKENQPTSIEDLNHILSLHLIEANPLGYPKEFIKIKGIDLAILQDPKKNEK
ncbi:hypothetical protein HAX54_022438, partial [Datura stramonium]|nr:hypothetical protein [Datura stramonium]